MPGLLSTLVTGSTDLASKYGLGEIAELSAVSSYFDNGTSQWAESNTWIPAASLGAAVKASLRTDYRLVAATDQRALGGLGTVHMAAALPPAKTATVAAYTVSIDNTGACRALIVNASGARIVTIGQFGGNLGSGGINTITSDGTAFFSWASAASSTAFNCYTSTDGETWSASTLTGQATFSGLGSVRIGPSQVSQSMLGELFSAPTTMAVAAWCGARHLTIGPSAGGNWIAQRSVNGTAFSGDETVAILGSATENTGVIGWWYRNGNNFFIAISGAVPTGVLRKSTDGGVTWGAATGAVTGSLSTTRFRVNSSDPARLASLASGSQNMAFTADSGSTWTARTAPFLINNNTSFFGRGSTWVLCNGQTGLVYQTTNDGAAWTLISTPTGFVGLPAAVYADANRWYMLSMSSNQTATATTIGTWTVRNISNAAPGSTYTSAPHNLVATDANTIMGGSQTNGVALSTADGGVTWQWSAPSTTTGQAATGANYYVANTVGTPYFFSGQMDATGNVSACAIPAAGITALGNSYRVSTATITPTRANARTFVRVG